MQKNALGFSLLFTSLYGLTDELHQYFVPNRSCEVYDWIADVSGALFAYFFCKKYLMKNINGVLVLLVTLFFGCGGSENQSLKQKFVYENAEAWIDFMPGIGQDENRFHFVVKVKSTGENPDTNFDISSMNIRFNNYNADNKKFNKSIESVSGNSYVIQLTQSQNETYFDKQKENPEEVSFSFSIMKNNKTVKTINTPKIKIEKTY